MGRPNIYFDKYSFISIWLTSQKVTIDFAISDQGLRNDENL